jgi:hypothetical protein
MTQQEQEQQTKQEGQQLTVKQLTENDIRTKQILDDLIQKATTSHMHYENDKVHYENDKRDLIVNTASELEEHLNSTEKIQYIKRISEVIATTLKKKVKGFVTDSYMTKCLPEKYRVPPAPRIAKIEQQPQDIDILLRREVTEVKPKTVEELLADLENAYRTVKSIINQINITGRQEGLTDKEITQKIKERIKTD